jgi:TRAP-type C4-dicarboxylate transport system permease large subunit
MEVEACILVVVFVACLLLNVPIAFAIAISAFAAITALGEIDATQQVAWKIAEGVESFPLLAIPFFILAGHLMGEGGMAKRLMNLANSLLGWLPAGLAYVNTLTCMLFGAISGSATAAISSIGGFMIPEMQRRGYGREFSTALTTTAATTGLLIPPSNIMIVYAVVANGTSVAAIFLAGVLPGILVGLLLMGVCLGLSLRQQQNAGDWVGVKQILADTLWALPSLFLVFIVLGGILGGVFSATEAAAIAVLYAFFIPGVHWCIDRAQPVSADDPAPKRGPLIMDAVQAATCWFRRMPHILLRAGKTNAIVMLLIGASQAMGWFLSYEQIPQQISAGLLNLSDNPLVILLIMNLVLLVAGTFLDMTPAVLIFTPIFLPVAIDLGMHPVHFGIVIIANLCIGLCTPPVGTCLFLGCSVGHTTIAKATRYMLPFYAAMLVALGLITYVPWLSMALPEWLGLASRR